MEYNKEGNVIYLPRPTRRVLSIVGANPTFLTFTPENFVETVICFLATCKENGERPLEQLQTGTPLFARAFQAMRSEWIKEGEAERNAHGVGSRWRAYHSLNSNFASEYFIASWLRKGNRTYPCVQPFGMSGLHRVRWLTGWKMPLKFAVDQTAAARCARVFRFAYQPKLLPPPPPESAA
ncbi:MAG: hypothetical protein AAB597_03380 [Patescibacteria group bacterium]